MDKSLGSTEIDFDKPGRQVGFLDLPYSPNDDAWGVIRIPLAVIANGTGPTIILEGGNHGDEYEGPIVIGELIRGLDPKMIQGRLICIPAINLPAVSAGQRVSPYDNLNFNRTFPGDPLGSITQQISAYVNDTLFPMADAFLDLHSGGSSMMNIPSAIIEPADDPAHLKRNIDAAVAFDAPMTVVIGNRGDPRTSTASAVRAGLTVVGTEMAGGGTVTPEAVRICWRGVNNVLAHLGVLPAPIELPTAPPPMFAIPGRGGHVLATSDGVFEPFHDLGTKVSAGQPAGRIHHLTDPARAPEEIRYGTDGTLYARRHPGKVRPGNCCAVVVVPYTR